MKPDECFPVGETTERFRGVLFKSAGVLQAALVYAREDEIEALVVQVQLFNTAMKALAFVADIARARWMN